MTPTVSVVLTCFNLGAYLEEAIASVRGQTFTDYELLIVNDGSTDADTCALLAKCEADGNRVVHSANFGLPGAKNVGVRHTAAPYLCFLDADDRLEPNMLARSVRVLESDESIAFVSHWVRYFGAADGVWQPDRCDFPTLLDVNTVNGAALVRRSAVAAAGGFDESFRSGCEDWDFWITLVERGFPGVILPEILFNYRRRHDSMSRTMLHTEGHPALYRKLVEKHQHSFGQHLPFLLARRERDLVTMLRESHDLDREYGARLQPQLATRLDDVAALERQRARQSGGGADAQSIRILDDLRQRLASAEARIQDLTTSKSWRITAPLRAAYDVWLRANRVWSRRP